MKAQAVLFDAIMFMLLSSVSVAIIFSFISTYGQQETAVLQSANILNYIQSIIKVSYFIDASTLYKTNITYGPDKADNILIPLDCSTLSNFYGVSVAQLLKKDLSDGAFNNLFGSSPAPGKKALRCLMYQVMQPFTTAGYDYHVDIVNLSQVSPPFIQYPYIPPSLPSVGYAPDMPQYDCGQASDFTCYNVSQTLNSTSIMTVGTPFFITPAGQNTSIEYVINLCVWKQQNPINNDCKINLIS